MKKEKQETNEKDIKKEKKLKKTKETKEETKVKKNNKITNLLNKTYKKMDLQKARFTTIEIVLLGVMTLTFGIIIGELFFSNKNISLNSYNTEIDKVYETLITEYKDEIDQSGLTDAAINGMMEFLEDKYSIFFDQDQTNDFYEELDGTFIGLGVEITLGDDNIPVVANVLENTAAQKAEIKVGDKFLKVDGVDVTSYSLTDLSKKIKGNTPKTLTLTLQRDNNEIEKKITTQEVEIKSVTSDIFEVNNKKIGYIYLSVFASNTDEQFKKELETLEQKNIDSLIIDVRSNLGGHLDTVTNILNLFLNKSQVLYQLKDGDKINKVYGTTNDTKKYNIAVLIDSASASASEVLASAMKEAYQADIVGTKSYGKGTVQTTMILSSGSMIKYTSEEWLTSNGNSINEVGLEPNINVALDQKYITSHSDQDDNQLQAALSALANK